MGRVDVVEDGEMAAAAACVDAWIQKEVARDGLLVAAERQDVTDSTASSRWYLRFKGEEKEFITVWLTLRQRTLHHEAQFMPAPEENRLEVVQYLMRRNADLYAMAFCLGTEDAVYLVGKVPAAQVDEDELDRIAGSTLVYVDDHFPTAMTLGHPTLYRRRPKR
ncbi:MAG: YbjN domain-containing protein [Acidimicrobiales bacterium]|jgi:hypothetical protein